MGLILDSNFVITAERESRKGIIGRTDAFFALYPEETYYLPFSVTGELAAGDSAVPRSRWESLCKPYATLPWSKEVAWQYGEIYRALKARGRLIGSNDLWIAATALTHNLPLVTNDVDEFDRVQGLTVLPY